MICNISLERAQQIMNEELDARREGGERYALANSIVNLYAANKMLMDTLELEEEK